MLTEEIIAQLEGMAARRDDKLVTDNPYKQNTLEYDAWNSGWTDPYKTDF